MILGIGIDIVDIKRFKSVPLKRWGDSFTARLFTEDELIYCLRKNALKSTWPRALPPKRHFLRP